MQVVLMFLITKIFSTAPIYDALNLFYPDMFVPLQTDSPFNNYYVKIVIIESNSISVTVGPVAVHQPIN